jgi:predicted DNA-binding transcriptional regulator AlpA
MDFLTTEPAAQFICMSVAWLEKRPAHGPKHIKLGRKVVYERAELKRWLRECAAKTKHAA